MCRALRLGVVIDLLTTLADCQCSERARSCGNWVKRIQTNLVAVTHLSTFDGKPSKCPWEAEVGSSELRGCCSRQRASFITRGLFRLRTVKIVKTVLPVWVFEHHNWLAG